MANLNFKWGLHANLPKSLTNDQVGALFFTKDEGGLYLGVEAGAKPQRIQGVVQYYATLNEFKSDVLPPYSEDVIYYIASENALVKWNGEKAGANGIKEEGKFTILNVTASEFNTAVTDINTNKSNIAGNTSNISGLRTDLGANNGDAGTTAFGRIAALESAVDALEELTGTGGSGTSLADRITALETWKGTASTAISTLQSDVAGHTSTLAEQGGKITALETWKGTTDTALAGIGTDITNLKSEDTGIKSRLSTAEGKITTAEGNITTLTSDLGSVTSRVTEAEGKITSQGTRLGTAESDIDALEAWKGTASTTIAGHTDRLNGIDGSITTINSTLGTLRTDLDAVDSAADGLRADLGTNDKSDTTAFARIAALEAASEATDSAAGALAGRVTTLENTTANHETRLGTAETDIDNLEKDLEQAKSDLATKAAASDLNTLKGRVDGHDTAIENIEKNIDNVEKDIEDINTAIGNATNPAAGTVYAAIKQNATDIAANASDINKNEQAIAGHETRLAAAEGKIATAEGKISSIEGVNTEQGNKISSLEGRMSTAEGEIDTLQADVLKNAGDITTLNNNLANNYYTKTEADGLHNTLKTNLETQLTTHINAANALTYVGGVDNDTSWRAITAAATEIGKTYVVSAPAVTLTINGTQTACYAGDLLIATAKSGKSETNGVLAAADTEWIHVKAGYNAELNDTLDIVDGDGASANKKATVRLSSYAAAHDTDAARGDLGKFSIVSSSNNLDVTVSGENINVAMVWDTF